MRSEFRAKVLTQNYYNLIKINVRRKIEDCSLILLVCYYYYCYYYYYYYYYYKCVAMYIIYIIYIVFYSVLLNSISFAFHLLQASSFSVRIVFLLFGSRVVTHHTYINHIHTCVLFLFWKVHQSFEYTLKSLCTKQNF